MAHVGQHLLGGRTDIDLTGRDTQGFHQLVSVISRAFRGPEAGQAIGQDVGAGQAQPVHRPAGHDQRLGGIQPARHSDHGVLGAGGLQPLGQALNLDVVGLVAVLPQPRRVRRHEGEALEGALQRHRLAWPLQRDIDPTEGGRAVALVLGAVAEGIQPHAFLTHPAEVDVGESDLVAVETLRFDQFLSALEHPRLAVPGQICGGFSRSRRSVDVGRASCARLAGAEQTPGLGLADGDVGGRQVDQHLRPGQGRRAGWRNRGPEVLADLHVEAQRQLALGAEQQVYPERRGLAGHDDLTASLAGARSEIAALVELAVVGQIGLGDHAQDAPTMDHHGGVVEPARSA